MDDARLIEIRRFAHDCQPGVAREVIAELLEALDEARRPVAAPKPKKRARIAPEFE